mgnify:CR=1 FL=1
MTNHLGNISTAHQAAIDSGQGPAFIAAMREYLKHHDMIERAKQ